MPTVHERLKQARLAAGHEHAVDAARALGIGVSTYLAYENGQNGISRQAQRLARAFKVDLNWLLTGKGDMRGKAHGTYAIPVHGVVSAGLSALPIPDQPPIDEIQLPEAGRIAALRIKGDSMWPRYMDGEALLYDPLPQQPGSLINKFAVVQTLDGRVMVKQIRPARRSDHWMLWSHNAPEEEAQLLSAFAIIGVLA